MLWREQRTADCVCVCVEVEAKGKAEEYKYITLTSVCLYTMTHIFIEVLDLIFEMDLNPISVVTTPVISSIAWSESIDKQQVILVLDVPCWLEDAILYVPYRYLYVLPQDHICHFLSNQLICVKAQEISFNVQ